MNKHKGASFPALVQEFFTDYLVNQRAISPQTVASYRDAFTMLLQYADHRLGKTATTLQITDLNGELIAGFLDHLESQRGNSVRSRNARLAAIRSFLHFVARRDVAHLNVIERALAVPMKRFEKPTLNVLTREHILAIIDVPTTTWFGQRDHLLLTLLYNTGARVSEIVGIRVCDTVLRGTPCIHLHGKGRKQRTVPIWKSTAKEVKTWLKRNVELTHNAPLLPTRAGKSMTRANVAQRLRLAVDAARAQYPELCSLRISPHSVRHATAMHLLQSGIDISVIALWLGHESTATTHIYLQADLKMKEQALSRIQPPHCKLARYRPSDKLMQFLKSL